MNRAEVTAIACRPGYGPEEETARAVLRLRIPMTRKVREFDVLAPFKRLLDPDYIARRRKKMSNYAKIRKTASRNKYAAGGRVAVPGKTKAARTTINIIVPPSGGMPAPGMAPAAPPAVSPSPAAGQPVPPAAAQMALSALQGKPGAPGAFARGGRVKCADGGAASGVGRLENAAKAKRRGK
jgi:hypothetical protein